MYRTAGSLLLCCLLAACKSATVTAPSEAGVLKTEERLFTALLDHSFRFETLSARLKFEFHSPEKEMNAKAQLKMIYNERIQLSLQPFLGIELFRLELTVDSLKILDRMNKRYLTESYENIKGKAAVDFNFHSLQALFANHLFLPGESSLSPQHFRRFRTTREEHALRLQIKDRAGMLYSFTTGENDRLRTTSIRDKSGRHTLTWDYRDFRDVGDQPFPFRMEAALTSGDREQGAVTFSFSPPDVNSPLRTDFNIPPGYRRVSFSQIIKWLDKQ
jgi:hypothetical protein